MTNFIQLREQDAIISSNIPGTYSTVLDKSLKLENNDVLSINSVFCDTRHTTNTTTGKIDITDQNDNFEVSFGYYLVNGFNDAAFTYTDETAPNAQNIPKPDCKKYILSLGTTGDSDLFNVQSFAFTGQQGATYKAFDITFQLFSGATPGLPKSVTLHCPKQDGKNGLVKVQMPANKGTDNFELTGIIVKGSGAGGTFEEDDMIPSKPSTDSLIDDYNITNPTGTDDGSPYKFDTFQEVINDTLTPVINKFSFTIPQNSYTPDSLAKIITDKMTAYKHGSDVNQSFVEDTEIVRTVNTFATRNAFFTSHKQLQTDPAYGLSARPTFYLVSEDGNTILQIDRASADNYIIGAAQMALQYDDTLNKFLFTQIHTNIFETGGAPIIQYVRTGGVAPTFNLQGAHSGVFFSAVNDDTHQLFFDDMGFDSSLIVPPYTPTVEKTFGAVLVTSKVFTVNLIEGVNITSNLDTSDAGLQHNENFIKAPNPTNLTAITSIEVNSIIGSNNRGSGTTGQLSEGYFLVEISGIPSNNVVNSINNNISCIVSKYQATEDFTISIERAGAIQYQHKGEPLMISKLDVRILDPNGAPSKHIGNNNTVFIELIKSNST